MNYTNLFYDGIDVTIQFAKMENRSKNFSFNVRNFDVDNEGLFVRQMLEHPQVGYMLLYCNNNMGGDNLRGLVQFTNLMSGKQFEEFIGDRRKVEFRRSLEPLNELVSMKREILKAEKPVLVYESGDVRRFKCSKLRFGTKRQKCFVRWWNEHSGTKRVETVQGSK